MIALRCQRPGVSQRASLRAQGSQRRRQAHGEAGKGLELVASQLLAGPKAAVHSCHQTFQNAHHNWSLLGESIMVRPRARACATATALANALAGSPCRALMRYPSRICGPAAAGCRPWRFGHSGR